MTIWFLSTTYKTQENLLGSMCTSTHVGITVHKIWKIKASRNLNEQRTVQQMLSRVKELKSRVSRKEYYKNRNYFFMKLTYQVAFICFRDELIYWPKRLLFNSFNFMAPNRYRWVQNRNTIINSIFINLV